MGGNRLPAMFIFPPIYAGQAAVSYQEDPSSLVRAGCSPTHLKTAAWIPPTLKSKIKGVQCLHISLLSL